MCGQICCESEQVSGTEQSNESIYKKEISLKCHTQSRVPSDVLPPRGVPVETKNLARCPTELTEEDTCSAGTGREEGREHTDADGKEEQNFAHRVIGQTRKHISNKANHDF